MSDDRAEQTRAEAEGRLAAKRERRWDAEGEHLSHSWGAGFQAGFRETAEWADANPHSTPEALVAAYEDGQRDAVEKGLAKMRITADQCNEIEDAVREGVPLGHMLRRLGIEVEDDERHGADTLRRHPDA